MSVLLTSGTDVTMAHQSVSVVLAKKWSTICPVSIHEGDTDWMLLVGLTYHLAQIPRGSLLRI